MKLHATTGMNSEFTAEDFKEEQQSTDSEVQQPHHGARVRLPIIVAGTLLGVVCFAGIVSNAVRKRQTDVETAATEKNEVTQLQERHTVDASSAMIVDGLGNVVARDLDESVSAQPCGSPVDKFVNSFHSKKVMKKAGWSFHPESKTDFRPAKYSKFSGSLRSTSYWGFNSDPDKSMAIKVSLKGTGNVYVEFGSPNVTDHGYTSVWLDQDLVAAARPGTSSQEVFIPFTEGQVLRVESTGEAVIALHALAFDCSCGTSVGNIDGTFPLVNALHSQETMRLMGWDFSQIEGWAGFRPAWVENPKAKYSYWGYKYPGDGAIQRTLKGSGTVTVDVGNSYHTGATRVYRNAQLVGSAGPTEISKKITFKFANNDVLKIQEEEHHGGGGVLVVNSITFTCDTKKAPVKVACVGDSITWGHGAFQPRGVDAYPGQLGMLLGSSYRVMNFGSPGSTAARGHHWEAYNTGCATWAGRACHRTVYQELMAGGPYDVVIVQFGTNDGWVLQPEEWNECLSAGVFNVDCRYARELLELLHELKDMGPNGKQPKIFVAVPPPAESMNQPTVASVVSRILATGLLMGLSRAAFIEHGINVCGVIHNYNAFGQIWSQAFFVDSFHPNPTGYKLLAGSMFQGLLDQDKLFKCGQF